jgi:poly-gamma-glutamate synthesis protein (capsule biosynthesis protein)
MAPCLFLCGDVMTGRGLDQILPHPSEPRLYEPVIKLATDYVDLAEAANGPIARPVDFSYVWGDAIAELERVQPDARVINLETSVTTCGSAADKDIHYRMNPRNIGCLTAANIDCCALANNHVLDWGEGGLLETLRTLSKVGLATAGAGANLAEARSPAVIGLTGGNRLLVFAFGMTSSGIPRAWAARPGRAGINLIPDLSANYADAIADQVRGVQRPGDVVIASIHWGGNWGYAISPAQRTFAHRLIETTEVHLIHGHSSHHFRAIEVYQGKLILYGCGDFLNDYEGISGYESFRSDLALMYFASVDPGGGYLRDLEIIPLRTRRMRLERVPQDDRDWTLERLNREGSLLGTSVVSHGDASLWLKW